MAGLIEYGTLRAYDFFDQTEMTQPSTFEETFRERVMRIEAEARECGLNWTSICQEAGVSRATPDRWKKSTPKTIELVDRMEQIVAKRRAEAA